MEVIQRAADHFDGRRDKIRVDGLDLDVKSGIGLVDRHGTDGKKAIGRRHGPCGFDINGNVNFLHTLKALLRREVDRYSFSRTPKTLSAAQMPDRPPSKNGMGLPAGQREDWSPPPPSPGRGWCS